MEKASPGFFSLALAWFVHLPLVSKLLVFFGVFLLIAGLFGWIPARTMFSFRLTCLGLSWDYFFRFRLVGTTRQAYRDGSIKEDTWVNWDRLIGGLFFLGLAVIPSHYLFWLYYRLST
jgi:hypothetical protein